MMEIVYAIADDRDAEIGDALRSALDSRATPVSGMPDFRGAYEEAGRRRRSRILRVSVPAFAVAVAATATAASLAVAALLPLRSATDAASAGSDYSVAVSELSAASVQNAAWQDGLFFDEEETGSALGEFVSDLWNL